MEAMVDRRRRNGSCFTAVKSAVTKVLKSLLDNLTAPVTGMIDVGQEVESTYRLFRKYENGIDELVVREGG